MIMSFKPFFIFIISFTSINIWSISIFDISRAFIITINIYNFFKNIFIFINNISISHIYSILFTIFSIIIIIIIILVINICQQAFKIRNCKCFFLFKWSFIYIKWKCSSYICFISIFIIFYFFYISFIIIRNFFILI